MIVDNSLILPEFDLSIESVNTGLSTDDDHFPILLLSNCHFIYELDQEI